MKGGGGGGDEPSAHSALRIVPYNTMRLSRHEQVFLMRLRFEKYFLRILYPSYIMPIVSTRITKYFYINHILCFCLSWRKPISSKKHYTIHFLK